MLTSCGCLFQVCKDAENAYFNSFDIFSCVDLYSDLDLHFDLNSSLDLHFDSNSYLDLYFDL